MDIYLGHDADGNPITRPATPAEVAAISALI